MLAKIIEKCKVKWKIYEKDFILATIIILVSLISFGLGRLSKIEEGRVPVKIYNSVSNGNNSIFGNSGIINNNNSGNDSSSTKPSGIIKGNYVASKNGTKYHFPWCPGAQRIKEENKIWFQTEEEAKKAGYSPASNCPGLK